MRPTREGLKFAADTLRTAKQQAASGNTEQARKTLARGAAECETPNDRKVLRQARDR